MLIKENRKIRLLRNILYLGIVGIWMTMDFLLYMGYDIGNYLTDPLYYSILKPLRYGSYLFCIVLQTYKKRELLLIIPVSAVLFVSGRFSGNNTLFYLWLFILMAKEISFRSVALEATLILTAGTVFFIVLYFKGIAWDFYLVRPGDGTVRHSLGFCHPNCLSQAIVILAMGYGCIRRAPLKIWDYCILIGLAALIWIVPNSRTAAACLVLYIFVMCLYPVYRKLEDLGRRRVTGLLVFGFIACACGMVALCVLYDPDVAWMNKLDLFLSYRLSYCKAALDEFGISLFGQQVYLTPSERSFAGLSDLKERIVDVAFVHIMLRNGLIPMLLLTVGIAAAIWHAGVHGNYAVTALMFVSGVFSVSENLYRNTAFCFFIIAVSEVLYGKTDLLTGYRTLSGSVGVSGDVGSIGGSGGVGGSGGIGRSDGVGGSGTWLRVTGNSAAQEIYLPDIRGWFRLFGGVDFVALAAFSVLFGCCASLGRNILHSGTFVIGIKEAVLWGGLCFTALSVMKLLTGRQNKLCRPDSRRGVTMWSGFFILLLLCYGICFLAYYPGVGMNDGLNILFEGVTTSRYMPPLYVAYVVALGKIGTRLGSIRYAIVLYSVIQLLVTAGFTAAFLTWAWKKRFPRWLKWILTAYFALSPLLALYAISMVKDTFFSLALTGICLALSDVSEHKEYLQKRIFWPVFIGLCVMTVIFRNNGPYIVLALAFILLLIFRGQEHRKGILALVLAVVLTMGAGKIVKTRFHSEQLFQESVAIPLQQICRVIAEDGKISEEQLEFMNELLPVETIRECYDPYCADYIKWDLDFNHDLLNERKAEFMKLWWDLMLKNPGIYIKAFLQETFWFWAPVQEGELQVFYTIEGAGKDKPLQQFCVDNGIRHASLLPEAVFALLSRYYTLASGFLREGICFWIFAGLGLLRILQRKKFLSLLNYLPVLLLWGTVMISAPISDSFRYVLVYAYMLPLYAAELFECRDAHMKLQ